MLHAVKTQ